MWLYFFAGIGAAFIAMLLIVLLLLLIRATKLSVAADWLWREECDAPQFCPTCGRVAVESADE